MITIEIIAISDEVLSGFIVNTNAAFIAHTLALNGFKVIRHSTLPNDKSRLKQDIQFALERSDIVICTGGLGPTHEDVSRKVAAELFDSEFHYDDIRKDLEKRDGKQLITLEDQATAPAKARVIKNIIGTAPGFIFKQDDKALILLPGVPQEMKQMLNADVIPYLIHVFPPTDTLFRKIIHLCLLSESVVDRFLRTLKIKYPHIHFGIYFKQSLLDVHIMCVAFSKEESEELLNPCIRDLHQEFKHNIFESLTGYIEDAIHMHFIQNNQTLALAESCTGGAIASGLTKIPDASQYFLGSIVSYTNAAKKNILNVNQKTLDTFGAVSQETVTEMAIGAGEILKADYSIAVSGIAGPGGGSQEQPVGTIWAAIRSADKPPLAWGFIAKGDRRTIIKRTVNHVLAKLYLEIRDGIRN